LDYRTRYSFGATDAADLAETTGARLRCYSSSLMRAQWGSPWAAWSRRRPLAPPWYTISSPPTPPTSMATR